MSSQTPLHGAAPDRLAADRIAADRIAADRIAADRIAADGVDVARSRPGAVHATIAGGCASLVGIGLARFAYTPLLPAIVDAGWFEAGAAAYLGAANLAGYLLGALLARPMSARRSPRLIIRMMMLLVCVTLIACASPLSFAWFFVWRLLSGFAGGALMVLAAPTVLPQVPAARRGLASGAIFMGVGAGVVASATLLPWLMTHGLPQAWLSLGLLSLTLTVIAWRGWPATATPPASGRAARKARTAGTPASAATASPRALRALFAGYALSAAGWVPHMLFLVDFVARGQGRGLQAGAGYWLLFGIGATIGPVLWGLLADRIGFARTLRRAFVVQAVAVALPALALPPAALIASSLIIGAAVTGTVPLVLGRLRELLPTDPDRQGAAWRTATVAFASFQALAAYLLSFVFALSGSDYALLFILAAVALTLALLLDLSSRQRRPVTTPQTDR